MDFYTFIISAMILLCVILFLVLALTKCDNIKQLNLHISATHGVEVKSLFYKKQ